MLQNLKSHVDVDFVGDCNGLLIVMLILMATMLMLIVRLEDFLVLVGKCAESESQKPRQRVSNSDRKVFANPESFCDKFIIG